MTAIFHLEGGSAEAKLSSNTLFHSGAPDERGELRMTWCSSKDDHLALSVLVYFNTTLLFKLEHTISDTESSEYPDLCLQHMNTISFCPDLYFKELFASLSQVNYEHNGGMYRNQCAKAVVMMMQCLNVKVTQAWETRGLEGKPLDMKSPPHGA